MLIDLGDRFEDQDKRLLHEFIDAGEQGELRFSTTQPIAVLAQASADGAAAALAEYGEDGYQSQWVEAPFPIAQLEMIRERLAEPKQ